MYFNIEAAYKTASLEINEEIHAYCGSSTTPYLSALKSVGFFLFIFCCSPIEMNIAGEK